MWKKGEHNVDNLLYIVFIFVKILISIYTGDRVILKKIKLCQNDKKLNYFLN